MIRTAALHEMHVPRFNSGGFKRVGNQNDSGHDQHKKPQKELTKHHDPVEPRLVNDAFPGTKFEST
jgi:hypothetical protein